jgi:hypothetical protein
MEYLHQAVFAHGQVVSLIVEEEDWAIYLQQYLHCIIGVVGHGMTPQSSHRHLKWLSQNRSIWRLQGMWPCTWPLLVLHPQFAGNKPVLGPQAQHLRGMSGRTRRWWRSQDALSVGYSDEGKMALILMNEIAVDNSTRAVLPRISSVIHRFWFGRVKKFSHFLFEPR